MELSEIKEKALIEFGELNVFQLNWKSMPNQWSIAQCLDHLIVSNGKYMPLLHEVASGKHQATFWEKYNPFTAYTGKKMIETLGAIVIRRYKSPMLFSPSVKNTGLEILTGFLSQQDELMALFEKLNDPELKSVVITSPVAALITLKTGDVMKLIVAHEERHILQAIRIKNNAEFPNN